MKTTKGVDPKGRGRPRSDGTKNLERLAVLYRSGKLRSDTDKRFMTDHINRVITSRLKTVLPNRDWRDTRQEVWLVLLKKLRQFDPKRGAITTWIYALVDLEAQRRKAADKAWLTMGSMEDAQAQEEAVVRRHYPRLRRLNGEAASPL